MGCPRCRAACCGGPCCDASPRLSPGAGARTSSGCPRRGRGGSPPGVCAARYAHPALGRADAPPRRHRGGPSRTSAPRGQSYARPARGPPARSVGAPPPASGAPAPAIRVAHDLRHQQALRVQHDQGLARKGHGRGRQTGRWGAVGPTWLPSLPQGGKQKRTRILLLGGPGTQGINGGRVAAPRHPGPSSRADVSSQRGPRWGAATWGAPRRKTVMLSHMS